MDFSEILDKAWQITWKHKVLWIFGILAGCARGRTGGSFGSGSGWRQGQPFGPDTTLQAQQFFAGIVQWIGGHLWVVALFVLLALALAALFIFLGTVGRIALIRGAFEADGGAERLAFGELWRSSLPFFWRVFGLLFLIGLAFFIVLMPLILFGVVTAGVGFLCILPLLCLLALAAWVIGIVVHQANAAMVIENLGLADGLRRGWDVVKNNVGAGLGDLADHRSHRPGGGHPDRAAGAPDRDPGGDRLRDHRAAAFVDDSRCRRGVPGGLFSSPAGRWRCPHNLPGVGLDADFPAPQAPTRNRRDSRSSTHECVDCLFC